MVQVWQTAREADLVGEAKTGNFPQYLGHGKHGFVYVTLVDAWPDVIQDLTDALVTKGQ